MSRKKKIVCFMLCAILWLNSIAAYPLQVNAGTYDDARVFYQTYGNRMIFVPSSKTDGNIYCATKAKRTSSDILFSTIGWKAVIRKENGEVLQEIYFKLGGNYLKTVDGYIGTDGYEYLLYAVSLKDLKSRLNGSSMAALESGTASMVFDACLVVKKKGIPSGGMTDLGISWGTVHTTYESIIRAELWSAVTQESLHSYFNKNVEGMFYTIRVEKDAGIACVNGAGTYCYGTIVHLYAIPRSGYAFSHWGGDISSSMNKTSIIVQGNQTYKAFSLSKNLLVTYYRNLTPQDNIFAKQIFVYGDGVQYHRNFGWRMTGYYLNGWKYDRRKGEMDIPMAEPIHNEWIKEHIPEITLYANWCPNRYTVTFDRNGVDGPNPEQQQVNYESVITMPECAYAENRDAFLGWGLDPNATTPDYVSGESVALSDLTRRLGIEKTDGATITLYAIWNRLPSIKASNIYISLVSAREGKVTEDYLASYASAADQEDGNIPYGSHAHTSLLLEDYDPEIYRNVTEEGYVTETYVVKDSSGNIVRRSIRVYLVDTSVYSESEYYGSVRFISGDYLSDENGNLRSEEEGGLNNRSVWRKDLSYLELLQLNLP